jgi:hypothetical protein
MSNIVFGSVIGVISGKYIFEEPLKQHFEEHQKETQDGSPPSNK